MDDKIKLIIEVQHLSALSVPGTCDMTVKNLKNESFTATLSGVGSLKLSGNTANFKCTVSGAGLVNAREFIANHTDITLSGAGSAEVYGIPKSIPIKETHPLNPVNPYAETKKEQESICNR